MGARCRGSGALELERYVELGAIGLDFALVIQLHIELYDLSNSKIPERLCGSFDRIGGRLLP